MAKSDLKVSASIDADGAIRDALFWLDMLVSKLTFRRVDLGRWKRYVKVEKADAASHKAET